MRQQWAFTYAEKLKSKLKNKNKKTPTLQFQNVTFSGETDYSMWNNVGWGFISSNRLWLGCLWYYWSTYVFPAHMALVTPSGKENSFQPHFN